MSAYRLSPCALSPSDSLRMGTPVNVRGHILYTPRTAESLQSIGHSRVRKPGRGVRAALLAGWFPRQTAPVRARRSRSSVQIAVMGVSPATDFRWDARQGVGFISLSVGLMTLVVAGIAAGHWAFPVMAGSCKARNLVIFSRACAVEPLDNALIVDPTVGNVGNATWIEPVDY